MKMIDKFEKIVDVISLPEKIEEGVLYISNQFGVSCHLCPCGCCTEINIPLRPTWHHGWNILREYDKVTLSPSLLNTSCPNKAHYFIVKNEIHWCK